MLYAWLETGIDRFGPSAMAVSAGVFVGLLFGFMGQRSRFCLRAAVIEFATAQFGEKLAIWLLTFGVAIASIQTLVFWGMLDVSETRALAAKGSMSGALLGGLIFGIGMVLARGCASRQLILCATGNLRALLTGLIFVVSAQAAYQGVLEPLRMTLSALWMVDGGAARDLMQVVGGADLHKLPIALVWLVAAILFAIRGKIPLWGWIGGIGAGFAVTCAYGLTYTFGAITLSSAGPKGITFSGPSAEVLMRILMVPDKPMDFDTGLIPGVFLGSGLAALLFREWKLQVFDASSGTARYILGGGLMGFGSMLAGGCAVGAGVSGGAIFALTAWLALLGMWIGAAITHHLVDAERPTLRPVTRVASRGTR